MLYSIYSNNLTLAIGLLIYLVSAAAVSGFLQPIAGVFADRFALIPSLGFSICITWLLFRIFKTSEFDESLTYQKLKPALKYTLVFIFVIYGSLTFARNFDWKDDLTLMRKDIKVVDKSAQAHNLLAIHLVNAAFAANDLTEQQRLREEALHHLKKHKKYTRHSSTYPTTSRGFIYY
ncbi:MAG: hypothetical protein IPN22_11270 [Bacteroidetes bacterium]|nr:hypothetical protein [Bacteroidota bacterium]